MDGVELPRLHFPAMPLWPSKQEREAAKATREAFKAETRDPLVRLRNEIGASQVRVMRYFSVAGFDKEAALMAQLGFEVASQSSVGRGGYGILVTYRRRTTPQPS